MKKRLVQGFVLFYLGATPGVFAIAGGMSPTIYLEEAASAGNMSLGYAGHTEELGQMWYNPAVIYDYLSGRTLALTYIAEPALFQQNYLFAGFGWADENIGRFMIGFSLLNNTFLESYNDSGWFVENFHANETLLGVAHTWKVSDILYISETLKFFYFDYNYASSFAGSLDLGVVVKPLDILSISLSIDNLAALPFNFGSGNEPLPPAIHINPALSFLNGKAKLFYMMKFYLPIYYDMTDFFEHKVGIELDLYEKIVQLRAGYDGSSFLMGVGANFQSLSVSLTYLPKDYEHLFSLGLGYSFDKYRPVRMKGKDGEMITDDELIDFYEGIRKYSEGKYKAAYDDFNKVLEVNPKHELAKKYRDRALTHMKTSDWLDAEQERLIALHKELARKYESQKNYGDSIHEWKQVLDINPADAEAGQNIERIRNMVRSQVLAHHKKGLGFYGENNKVKAIESFTSALSFDPDYVPSKEMLVKIKEELTQEELEEREKIEKQQKAEVFYNRGLSYYGRKSYEEAIAAFDSALELNPNHLDAAKYKAMAEEEWEHEKLGLKGIEAANRLYEKGKINVDEEKYYDAIKDFRLAIKVYPQHKLAPAALKEAKELLAKQVEPFIFEGKAAYQTRKFAEAKENFTSAIQVDPENTVAKLYLEKIDKEAASIIEVHMQEGRRDLENGKKTKDMKYYTSAIGHFDEVVRLDPKNAKAKELLGVAQAAVKGAVDKIHNKAMSFYQKENFQKAINVWREALAIDPANAKILEYVKSAEEKISSRENAGLIAEWNKKAEEFLQNREYAKSLGFINKTLNVVPNNAKALALKKLATEGKAKAELQDKISGLFVEGVREYKKRNYEKAIVIWEKIKKMDPENTLVDRYIPKAREAQKNRKIIDYINGMEFYKQEKWILAKSSFERALVENPGNQDARKMLVETEDRIEEERAILIDSADQKMREGKYMEAVAGYSQAQRLKKSDAVEEKRENCIKAHNYFEAGLKYLNSSDQVGLSIEKFKKVLTINYEDKKARENIELAKQKGKSLINVWLDQAENAESAKNYKRANALYTSVVEIAPGNEDALKGQSRVNSALRSIAAKPYAEGKEAMAIKNYTLAVEKFNETLEYVEKYEDAQELLKKARVLRAKQRRQAKSSKVRTSSKKDEQMISRGIVLYRQGKYREAIAIWSKIPKTSSAYSKAQKYIARARLKL